MAVQKRFETWPLDRLIPYENNPRLNDEAVADVMESIRQTDNLDPIEVDEEGVILSGHTRLKALKKLGYVETDVIIYVGLTDEQKRKYRLLANKTGEKSGWDIEKLDEELANLDFEGYDFGFDLGDEDEDDKYTLKVNIPQYEVTGDRPNFADMLYSGKADAMIAEIEAAEGITEEERSFLIQAARRHNVFNYRNIAEYYAHATPEMQQLMERSALVIIDVDNAIANGYARLSDDIMAMMENDNNFQTGGGGVIWMPEDFKAPKVLNARWKKGAG